MAKKLSIEHRIDNCYNSLAYLGAALLNEGELVKAERVMGFMRDLKELDLPGKPEVNANEKALIKQGLVISAIKELRGRTGLTLKEAKDAVDAYREAHGLQTFVSSSGV